MADSNGSTCVSAKRIDEEVFHSFFIGLGIL